MGHQICQSKSLLRMRLEKTGWVTGSGILNTDDSRCVSLPYEFWAGLASSMIVWMKEAWAWEWWWEVFSSVDTPLGKMKVPPVWTFWARRVDRTKHYHLFQFCFQQDSDRTWHSFLMVVFYLLSFAVHTDSVYGLWLFNGSTAPNTLHHSPGSVFNLPGSQSIVSHTPNKKLLQEFQHVASVWDNADHIQYRYSVNILIHTSKCFLKKVVGII